MLNLDRGDEWTREHAAQLRAHLGALGALAQRHSRQPVLTAGQSIALADLADWLAHAADDLDQHDTDATP